MKKTSLITVIFVLLFSHMVFAGEWLSDEIGVKYMQDDGTCKTGWHQDVDGKWYYLDESTGYMLVSTKTPDGYSVSATGEWVENVKAEVKKEKYENEVKLDVTTLDKKVAGDLGYVLPLVVSYNNSYNNYTKHGTITIEGVELSIDGIPYISFKIKDAAGIAMVSQHYKCILEDGSERTGVLKLGTMASEPETSCSFQLLNGYEVKDVFKNKVVSAEIWITEYEPENK